MKYYIFLLLHLTLASVDSRGCLYYFGACVEICPDGTYGYSVGCDNLLPEPTCRNPNPEKGAVICDFSACYCEPPTVRDEASNKCVALKDCPRITPVTPKQPVTPRVPVTPRLPVPPRAPVTPRLPVPPRAPVTPGLPVAPRAPVTPKLPVAPRDPASPGVPFYPWHYLEALGSKATTSFGKQR